MTLRVADECAALSSRVRSGSCGRVSYLLWQYRPQALVEYAYAAINSGVIEPPADFSEICKSGYRHGLCIWFHGFQVIAHDSQRLMARCFLVPMERLLRPNHTANHRDRLRALLRFKPATGSRCFARAAQRQPGRDVVGPVESISCTMDVLFGKESAT